jgi:drug/metabolite transporter (DMT)-like permease
VVSILGIILIMTEGHPLLLLKFQFDRGDLAILVAAISWASFSVYLKKFPLKLPPLLFLFVTSAIGSIMLFPGFLIELYLGHHSVWSVQTGMGLIYASAFSSVLGFTSWNLGIAKKGPAIAGYFFNLLPVYSTILAVLLLGEHLHVYHIFGIIMVLMGILLANLSR